MRATPTTTSSHSTAGTASTAPALQCSPRSTTVRARRAART
jgi:hypothetical protein